MSTKKPKKKTKVNKPRRHKLKKAVRMLDASAWIRDHEGQKLVQKYKKRYGLNSVIQAIDELISLGATFDEEYVDRVKRSVHKNVEHEARKREMKKDLENCLVKFDGISSSGKEQWGPISWTYEQGQQWAFVGANGSGKTLIAKLIANDVDEVCGKAFRKFKNIDVVSFEKVTEIIEHECEIDDTDFMDSIDPGTSVRDFILASVEESDQIDELLNSFNLTTHCDQGIKYLSTGEMRKLLLARAILSKPDMIVLDEPFDGLDTQSRADLSDILQSLIADGLPVVLIVNRFSEIVEGITHIAYLQDATITLTGEKDEMLKSDELARLHEFHYSLPETLPSPDESLEIPELDPALPVVELNDVVVKYGDTMILNKVNWSIEKGQHWKIIGPNGAGKSTLLSLVSGDHPQAYANDLSLFGHKRGSGESIWEIKKHIGIVSSTFQREYRIAASVGEVICSGFFDSIGVYQRVTASQKETAREWLKILNLEPYANKQFRTLSYGIQRMVLIARALIKRPHLLLLDEPCQGLDDFNRQLVLKLIDYVASTGETTLVYVTHHDEDHVPSINSTLSFVPADGGGFCVQQNID